MYSVLNKLSEYTYFYITKRHFIFEIVENLQRIFFNFFKVSFTKGQ